MSKLFSVLIVAAFLAASFSAVAQDGRSGPEQATAKKEASGQQADKKTAKHQTTRAGSDAKTRTAHRNSRGPLFKRRPMFK